MGHRILKIEKFFQNRVFRIDFTLRKNVFVNKKLKKYPLGHFLLIFLVRLRLFSESILPTKKDF